MIHDLIEWISIQVKTNQFFGAAAFASVAAALFASLKGVPKMIWDRIVLLISYRVTIYQTDELYDYITMWIRDNHNSKARNVEYSTKQIDDGNYIDDEDRRTAGKKAKEIKEIPVEDFFYMRKYGRWIRVSFGRDKLENANNLKSVYLKHYTFKGLFASRSIRRLVKEINEHYGNIKREPRFYISRGHYFAYMQTIKGKPLSQVVLNKQLKDSILKDITTWRESKNEYERRGIAHKRGHCYFGPPGTGKTTLARAIAIEYEMDVYNVNLNNIEGDDDMMSMFSEMNPNSILLFEDIDAYFDKRNKVNSDSKITFSGLLNALDGTISLNDVLIIITTNHIEKLDPALLRPGRIDIIKEIGFAKNVEADEYMSMFYLKDIKTDFNIDTSMCNIQNACLANPEDPEKALKTLKSTQINF